MLSNWFFTNFFYYFLQNGAYLDFITKKISEIFIRNFLIYGAQFFGEKYLIEFFTKLIFRNFFLFFSRLTEYSFYFLESFFFNIITSLLIIFSMYQLIFFLF